MASSQPLPPVIGLTGNIASGKSHVAEIFRGLDIAVQGSDQVAHDLMQGEAFSPIAAKFPDVIENGVINRKLLGAEVFGNAEKLSMLESILHPLVRAKNIEFVSANQKQGKTVVLEIPLLFETKADEICDFTIFLDVSRETQISRAMARAGMTEEKLKKILAIQEAIPLEEKRRRADFVIWNEPGNDTAGEVKKILHQLHSRKF